MSDKRSDRQYVQNMSRDLDDTLFKLMFVDVGTQSRDFMLNKKL